MAYSQAISNMPKLQKLPRLPRLPVSSQISTDRKIFTGEELAIQLLGWWEEAECGPNDASRHLHELVTDPLQPPTAARDYINKMFHEWGCYAVPWAMLEPDGPKLEQRYAARNLPITPRNNKMLEGFSKAVALWTLSLLDRLRKCAYCGKPFFARFRHSAYDSSACRLAGEVADPNFKKRKRDYMRKYMRRKRGKK